MVYKTARKIVVAVIGSTVVLIGVALFVLPGPGWLVVFAGLAILATEFVWARHVLRKVKQSASDVAGWFTGRSRTPAKPNGPPPARSSSSSSPDGSDAAIE